MNLPLLLTLAVAASTVGDMLLSHGMKRVGAIEKVRPRALPRLLFRILTCPSLLAGVALLVLYFLLFLVCLSRADVSLVVPATAATYVTTALLARCVLHERISPRRWLGIFFISLGVALVAGG